ncbi:MAG: hypothetical protein ACFE9I_11380 [Candidatus Hermodarchaeota archaeon]
MIYTVVVCCAEAGIIIPDIPIRNTILINIFVTVCFFILTLYYNIFWFNYIFYNNVNTIMISLFLYLCVKIIKINSINTSINLSKIEEVIGGARNIQLLLIQSQIQRYMGLL